MSVMQLWGSMTVRGVANQRILGRPSGRTSPDVHRQEHRADAARRHVRRVKDEDRAGATEDRSHTALWVKCYEGRPTSPILPENREERMKPTPTSGAVPLHI